MDWMMVTWPLLLGVSIIGGLLLLGARPFFRWYDFWVGVYYDQKERTLYICPLPMLGIRLVV